MHLFIHQKLKYDIDILSENDDKGNNNDNDNFNKMSAAVSQVNNITYIHTNKFDLKNEAIEYNTVFDVI